MTFTAPDPLAMGTRRGSIDPGVLLYMPPAGKMSPGDIEHMLYERSGLLGVSGLSGDMRVLLATDLPSAREAVDLFVFRIGFGMDALAASPGGLDGLVFTAGIGEHAPEIRAAMCGRLRWLGVDPGVSDARVEVHVIPTDEEAMIARHTIGTIA